MYLSTTVIESDPDIKATHRESRNGSPESVQLTLGNRAGVIFLSLGEAHQLIEALTAAMPMAVAR
jgi:hypothetical protein